MIEDEKIEMILKEKIPEIAADEVAFKTLHQ
jgi:hypothetical protein